MRPQEAQRTKESSGKSITGAQPSDSHTGQRARNVGRAATATRMSGQIQGAAWSPQLTRAAHLPSCVQRPTHPRAAPTHPRAAPTHPRAAPHSPARWSRVYRLGSRALVRRILLNSALLALAGLTACRTPGAFTPRTDGVVVRDPPEPPTH